MITLLYFLGLLILVSLDKLITVLVIKKGMRQYGDKALSMEKNPVQAIFFKEFGLIYGAILYGIVSMFTFAFVVWLLIFPLLWLGSPKSYEIAYGIVAVIYLLAIGNNIYWGVKNGNN